MQEKIDLIMGDESLLRSYLSYEKAASDEVTRIQGTKREIAKKLKDRGRPVDEIVEDTGLTPDEVKRL
jgi:hypothetical protein